MYDSLSIHWASTVPAFLALVCLPFPYLFYKYGSRVRVHCKFAAESDAYMRHARQAHIISMPNAEEKDDRQMAVPEDDSSNEDDRTVVDEAIPAPKVSTAQDTASLCDNNPYSIDRVHTRNSFS
ncbi:hypothetical protein ACHAPT_002262 [Fusarium lateritium]